MGTIEFTSVVAMAQFLAELVKQGIRFTAHERTNGEYLVTLTGGY